VLFRMDEALGLTAASIARPLQGIFKFPLVVIYEILVPTMIGWYFVARRNATRGSIALAYVAEMIAGPILYAIVPACGPIYAFGAQWLHPPSSIPVSEVQLAYNPNAFPSLHVATALVLVLFSPGRFSRAVSLLFLAGTVLATLATGEHYVIDLVPGLIFGCFAASVGQRKFRSGAAYFGVVLSWSLAMRFKYAFLVLHPNLVRTFVALSAGLALYAVIKSMLTETVPDPQAQQSSLPVSSGELPPGALRP
jgi:PAP2 superfamily